MKTVTESINNHVNGWMGAIKSYLGLSNTNAMYALTGIVILAGFVLYFIVAPIMLAIISRIANRERSVWVKAAYKQQVFHRIAWFIPGLVVLVAIPIISDSTLPLAPLFSSVLRVGAEIYLVCVVAAVLSALLDTVYARFMSYKMAHRYSIKSYIQVCKIILYSLTAIVVVSVLIGKSPLYLLTGLGAMTAVGMLVFKDSILGLVAGIQIGAYDIIRVGDWISMPKYGADGTVLDISLNTMKVQNFDKTIVTVPTFAILNESVQNWRGMAESGGRRIKRHITINVNSMKLCSNALTTQLSQLSLLKARLDDYLKEDDYYIDSDLAKLVNADHKCVSNLTMYRLYVEAYLRNHPCINQDMSFLVRELQNDTYGIPIEIYVFTNITDWGKYEAIQASIFDYLYSILPVFELEAYQYESETAKGFETGSA